ncbi:MAG TPA: MogA/MoaB family molybdenum cofactor biosynthesis protein [Gemmatales bacterium]|nr:MogA/MoaB family molybdenum cofactor biosynthesis protein [Gemmatales bacterium]HMP58841.1 MogA/MoaB family molybdenum cofactor biosynthesis protein [Gemmatales bacterium]
MGTESHRAAAGQRSIGLAVFTLSDTRTPQTDTSGQAIRELAEAEGHSVVLQQIVPDDGDQIRAALQEAVAHSDVLAILLTGGTGLSRRDATYEALVGMLERRLEGFGELFRMLSYQEIGSAAMLSRAVAGTIQAKVVFAMPGSTHAVRLAMTKLILPELSHLVWEMQR